MLDVLSKRRGTRVFRVDANGDGAAIYQQYASALRGYAAQHGLSSGGVVSNAISPRRSTDLLGPSSGWDGRTSAVHTDLCCQFLK